MNNPEYTQTVFLIYITGFLIAIAFLLVFINDNLRKKNRLQQKSQTQRKFESKKSVKTPTIKL